MMDQLASLGLLIVPAIVFILGAVLWAGWGRRKLGVSLMGVGVLLWLLVPVLMLLPGSTTESVQVE